MMEMMTRVNKPDGRYQRDRQEGHNGWRAFEGDSIG